jgi:antitoxin CptB
MNNDINILKKRLIYRSQYRSTKEMDKLIGSFVETNINRFDIDELNELEEFLNIDDDTLYKIYNKKKNEISFSKKKILNLFRIFKYNK